jgi:hypothetical protein
MSALSAISLLGAASVASSTCASPMEMAGLDNRPVCDADAPAPRGRMKYADGRTQWDQGWRHPEAAGECINEDYDDWKYDCPHCNCIMIYEGADA